MRVKEFVLPILLLGLLMLCCAVAGYAYAQRTQRAAAATAATRAAVCEDQLRAKGAVVDELRTRLDDLARRHREALAAAEHVLDGREAQIRALEADKAQRAREIERASDEDDDVAALGRLGIPHVLDRQLWPDAGPAAAAAH